jgi:tRNA nucleotidyltransferase (CCA-adding enzyme)
LAFVILNISSTSQIYSPQVLSVLSPKTWPFSLEWLPESAHLVGGNVRDALLGRKADYLDLDFVLPEGAVEVARAIAQHYRAGYVLLDGDRQIARVVFDRATVDFAKQVGDRLEVDLQRRDFTINAIAYHPHTATIIDPLHGCDDLRKRLIRMIAPENLKEDPLRLLRAYRQAAQLGFVVEPDTQATAQRLAPCLAQIAPERVQAELNYLLGTAQGTPLLKMAWTDQLLSIWLPHATRNSLDQIAGIDRATVALNASYPPLLAELTGWLKDQQKVSGMGRSWLRVAKLVCLMPPAAGMAEAELWRLKYSRLEVQSVLTVIQTLPWLEALATTPAPRKEQYQFFRRVGSSFPAVVVLGLAHGLPLRAIAPLIERFLDPNDPVAHPIPLISGRDLMKALNLSPSPRIGELLEAIQQAQAEGDISLRQEAIDFARRYSGL